MLWSLIRKVATPQIDKFTWDSELGSIWFDDRLLTLRQSLKPSHLITSKHLPSCHTSRCPSGHLLPGLGIPKQHNQKGVSALRHAAHKIDEDPISALKTCFKASGRWNDWLNTFCITTAVRAKGFLVQLVHLLRFHLQPTGKSPLGWTPLG